MRRPPSGVTAAAWLDRLGAVGAAGALGATGHTFVNLRLLRRPPAHPQLWPGERVSVLLPLRNEEHRVEPCLRALLAALDRLPEAAELVVVDDGSTDGTAEAVRRVVGGDDRVRLVPGRELAAGWLGKPNACAQAADAADRASTVYAFIDADVVVAPDGLAATVALLRNADLMYVSPYPRQATGSVGERLVQPLLQWSWLTFLPLRVAERSRRPSLAAANGQVLAVDAQAYRRTGGHAAPSVRDSVLEDLALARLLHAAGGRGGMADGTAVGTCRMYAGWAELRDGYAKSLWSSGGSPAGSLAVAALLALLYLLPPIAALFGSRRWLPAAGVIAGVAGRAAVSRRTGSRVWPDSLAHPASVAALGWLTCESVRRHRAGRLTWKGRPL